MDQFNVSQGATVYSSDGEKLGKVVASEGQYLVVEKGFFFPTDYYVPYSAIASAEGNDVYLSVGKDQALNSGWDQMGTYETTTTTTSGVADGATTADYAATGTSYAAGTETSGTIGSTYDAAGVDTTAQTIDQDTLRIPVHEEELTATKRTVEQGEVRIGKDVVSEERTLEVPVTEERVRVTRRTVDRDATAADANAFEEGVIEVPLRGEEVELQKRVRVAEEVEVAKEAVQRTERVAGTVRREEVVVEDATIEGGTSTSTGFGQNQ